MPRRLDTSYLHSSVHHHHTLPRLEDLDRVQVHLQQLGHGADQARHPHQCGFQGGHIPLRLVPIPLEKPEPLGLPHHLGSVDISERMDSEGDILKELHIDPAQPEDDQRAKIRVLGHPDQDLVSA